MTTIDASVITAFRTYYPEFADDSTWGDTLVTRSLNDADAETGSSRWGAYADNPVNLKARGMFAYAAHDLVMGKARERVVAAGGTPAPGARVQSKTVADESQQYAVPVAQSLTEDARFGSLTATLYGQEFVRLRRRAGTGAATTGAVRL